MNRRLLKNQAKEILKTNYWKILITIVLVDILSFNFVSIESQTNTYTNSQEIYLKIFNEQILLTITPFIISVLIIVFVASLLYTVLFVSVFKYGLVNKLKHIALGDGDQYDIFDGFRYNYKKIVILDLIASIHIILWSLLFIVPGIIKALEYTYIKEILEEHPDWSCKEVLKESKRLTYGHKWEIFVLNLSFFLWVLAFGFLDNFTFGLASYFLSPYTSMTDVMCYLWLKEIDQTEYVQAELMQNEFLC